MEHIINKANILWGGIAVFLATFFGEFWYLFLGFLVFNIADYFTGVAKAKYTNTENSNKGLKGIIKKVGYWLVIAIAFFVARSLIDMEKIVGIDLGITIYFGWFTLAVFIINEIRSILENLTLLGVNVPSFLTKGLEVASKKINESGDKK